MHLIQSLKLKRLQGAFLLMTDVQCNLMSRNVGLTRSRGWISNCRRSARVVDDNARWKLVHPKGFHSTPFLSSLGLVAVALTGAICSSASMERCWKAALPRCEWVNHKITDSQRDSSNLLCLEMSRQSRLRCTKCSWSLTLLQTSFHAVVMIWNDLVRGWGSSFRQHGKFRVSRIPHNSCSIRRVEYSIQTWIPPTPPPLTKVRSIDMPSP
jgi:hypothetical protein